MRKLSVQLGYITSSTTLQTITQNILDVLVDRGPQLGKAFCEVDPERNYLISKEQFSNAVSRGPLLSCNHLSDQAFLWNAQFPLIFHTIFPVPP